MKGLQTGALALALALSAGLPAAEPELGAENYLTEVNGNTVVGGASAQRLAQVFELHGSGELSHLMLPVACTPGTVLRVTIEDAATGVPGGTVLAVHKKAK